MTTPSGRRPDVAVVVPAAGTGTRLGAGAPKALRLLGGEPLLVHAVRRLIAADAVGCVVVAAPPGHEDTVRDFVIPAPVADHGQTRGPARRNGAPVHDRQVSVSVVTGGGERQQSVALALARVPAGFDIVLVHDAARAFTPPSLVEQVADAVRAGWEAVVPVLPVADTITQVDPSGLSTGHLDRATLRAVQTPQGFRREVLERAHAVADGTAATDDAGMVARLGVAVHTVPGSDLALKITTPADLAYAETLSHPPN